MSATPASATAATPPVVRFAGSEAAAHGACGREFDLAAAMAGDSVTVERVDRIRRYRVPKVTEEGTCSLPDDLEPEPFDLLATVFGITAPSAELVAHPAVVRLHRLQLAVEALAAATGAEWVGVYRVIPSPPAARPSTEGERALVKEAYVGSPSRPFFPLTAEFAASSNNSTVALTNAVVVIHDVRRMGGDEPYYNCDGKVRSEICAPITSPDGTVIGIIDAEAWRPNHFTPERIAAVLQACRQLGDAHLLLPLA